MMRGVACHRNNLIHVASREGQPPAHHNNYRPTVSLPKLVDFDWRVDTKTSSDSVARMSVPTCILNLQIQPKAQRVDATPQAEMVNVELSKETLDTMLDGLGKIRDQLASVANR